jgi:hypothetical protein
VSACAYESGLSTQSLRTKGRPGVGKRPSAGSGPGGSRPPRARPSREDRHGDDWSSAAELAAAVAQFGDRLGQYLPLERQAAVLEVGAEICCA